MSGESARGASEAPSDLREWLRGVIRVSPSVPPGFVALRSGTEQAVLVGDIPACAEDARSLCESAPYVVRYGEMGAPIRCECCGTLVAEVPEAALADEPPRRWRRGIWEKDGAVRRHTMRRCEWQRSQRAC